MDNNLKRTIILEHYQHPCHRERHENDQEYMKINSRNVSCIDNLDLYVKLDGDRIEDISFEGEACVISISSTSILVNMLIGKTVEEAISLIENYEAMIEEKDYDSGLLGEACVYDDVAKQPSRKKCATLSWHGLYKKLIEIRDDMGK